MGMSAGDPEKDNKSGGVISDWINGLASSLGFNMQNMGSATTNEEMTKVAEHNKQQSANLEKTDKGVKTATAVTILVGTAPITLGIAPSAGTGSVLATEGALLKGAISATTQAIANDGKIDPLTTGLDAVIAPGVGNLIDAAVDVNVSPSTGVQVDVVGVTKTPERAALDLVVGSAFGAANNKATGVILKNSETTAQKTFYQTMMSTIFGVSATEVKK